MRGDARTSWDEHWSRLAQPVHRLSSKTHAREVLASAGLEPLAVDFSARDAFIHVVVVARRPLA